MCHLPLFGPAVQFRGREAEGSKFFRTPAVIIHVLAPLLHGGEASLDQHVGCGDVDRQLLLAEVDITLVVAIEAVG